MTPEQLKQITEARMKSVDALIGAEDLFLASYTMAMALECALKAMICKTLRLSVYPENRKQSKIMSFFWTHEFEQLLIISGLSDIFSPSGTSSEAIQSWSDFTKEFPGAWSGLKYDYEVQRQFDKIKADRLYSNLTDSPWGVLTKIKEKW